MPVHPRPIFGWMRNGKHSSSDVVLATRWAPCEPLWRRVPVRSEDGALLADFMMLLPGLNRLGPLEQRRQLDCIAAALGQFAHTVVFADLNLRLNVLWVSFKPTRHACLDIVAAIQMSVPRALLISAQMPR